MIRAQFYYKNENAPEINKPINVGTAVILIHEGKILFEYRTDSDYWALIGGCMDMDESLETCAVREAWEECGVQIPQDDIKFYKVFSDPSRIISYPSGDIVRSITTAYYYNVDYPHQLKISEESRDLKYFSIDEIKSLNIVATHKHIILDFLDNYKP